MIENWKIPKFTHTPNDCPPELNQVITRRRYCLPTGLNRGWCCFGMDDNSIPIAAFTGIESSKPRIRKRLWIKCEVIGSKRVFRSKP